MHCRQREAGEPAHREPPRAASRLSKPPSAHRQQVQKNNSGVSGVITTVCRIQRRVQQRGGRQTGALPRQQSIPASTSKTDSDRCGPSSRTPSAPSRRPGPRPNPQRHHRRMIGIAWRQGAGPDPVICLVRRERGHGGHDQAQHRQRRQRGGVARPLARQTNVADTA